MAKTNGIDIPVRLIETKRPARAEIEFAWPFAFGGFTTEQTRLWLMTRGDAADKELALVGLRTIGPAQIENWPAATGALRLSWEVETIPR